MKRCIEIMILLVAFASTVNGQVTTGAVIQFQRTTHNFDTIRFVDGSTACTFRFTNAGDEPLVIGDVVSSCGCTVADWPRKPIMPGMEDSIRVRYHVSKPGSFAKTILIKSNATNSPKSALQIKGYVEEKSNNKHTHKKNKR